MSRDNAPVAPCNNETHDGAPAGLVPSDAELPVRAVSGGAPATLGGYTAGGGQAPLPPPGSTQGDGLPPSGGRR